ncbi:MAG: alpha/beta hydrolase [Lentisphaeraceae bacterium]|nr:alpha/beta hydrolase [Lentisphaeraceae bacterium]
MKHLLFLSLCILFSNGNSQEPSSMLALWPDRPLLEKKFASVRKVTKVDRPSMAFFKSKKAIKSAPAVIVFPGGAYRLLAYELEGTKIATWLNSLGYHAIVVKYTVPGNKRLEALKDAQRAIRLVRSQASNWGINPNKIGVIGFSAGGHLAAHLSTNYLKSSYQAVDKVDKTSCRPDFSILVYPAYIYKHKGSKELPKEIKVDSKTPPAFVVQTLDDRNLVASSFNYIRALNDAKVDAKLHLFAKGGHGYGLGLTKKTINFSWPELCEKWLEEITK